MEHGHRVLAGELARRRLPEPVNSVLARGRQRTHQWPRDGYFRRQWRLLVWVDPPATEYVQLPRPSARLDFQRADELGRQGAHLPEEPDVVRIDLISHFRG